MDDTAGGKGITLSMNLVYMVLEYMSNSDIVNVDRNCRAIAYDRSARVLQRSYRRWLADKDVCGIRTYMKKYVPLMFRDSFRNDLAIAVTITKCNALAYAWMSESGRLRTLNRELSTEDLKSVYTRAGRFVNTHRQKIDDMEAEIISQNVEDIKHNISDGFSIYVKSRAPIRQFVSDNDGPTDEPTIIDIVFRIQEDISMRLLHVVANLAKTMSIYELADAVCDQNIQHFVNLL